MSHLSVQHGPHSLVGNPLSPFSPILAEMSHQSPDLAQDRVWFMVALSPEFLSVSSTFPPSPAIDGLGDWAGCRMPGRLSASRAVLLVDMSTGSPCTGPRAHWGPARLVRIPSGDRDLVPHPEWRKLVSGSGGCLPL